MTVVRLVSNMDDLEAQYKQASSTLSAEIDSIKDILFRLYEARRSLWREMAELGIPKATIAKWSGLSGPMVVSRALQDDG